MKEIKIRGLSTSAGNSVVAYVGGSVFTRAHDAGVPSPMRRRKSRKMWGIPGAEGAYFPVRGTLRLVIQ